MGLAGYPSSARQSLPGSGDVSSRRATPSSLAIKISPGRGAGGTRSIKHTRVFRRRFQMRACAATCERDLRSRQAPAHT